MTSATSIDLTRIVAHGGSQHAAFEEFCSQLARRAEGVPTGSQYQRNGRGADLGVECLWILPNGTKWGWQAKYVFDIDSLKKQVDKSIDSAATQHKTLTKYVVCIPFTPSAARGRGRSQVEKFDAFKEDWRSRALRLGVDMTIEIWSESELSRRLIEVDGHGGLRRYWFDSKVFTREWCDARLDEVFSLVGPRYTPKLHFGHALASAFSAVGATSEWTDRVSEWQVKLRKAGEEWKLALGMGSHPASTARSDTVDEDQQVQDQLQRLEAQLATVTMADISSWDGLRGQTAETRVLVDQRRDALAEALAQRYGYGAPESQHFRNVQAEYHCHFPAARFDSAQKLSALLYEFSIWLTSPELRAAIDGVLVITGRAGIGKTHSVCDEANRRRERGLATIVLLGGRFGPGTVWDQVRAQLGIGSDWSVDALLDAMDALGQTTGSPVLLCVDALNETTPRSFWITELPGAVHQIAKRANIRLCVTCRTEYVPQVLGEHLDLSLIEHPGFAGIEFDACRSFFTFYELKPPVGPLLHPEFRNPLFLKIVCEARRAGQLQDLASGWAGFREMLQIILRVREDEFTREQGPAARGALSAALEALGAEMAVAGSRRLFSSDALRILDADGRVHLPPDTVFNRLIKDELILLLPEPVSNSVLAAPQESVVFAFERLGDHVIVQSTLRSSKENELPQQLMDMHLMSQGLQRHWPSNCPNCSEKSSWMPYQQKSVSSFLNRGL